MPTIEIDPEPGVLDAAEDWAARNKTSLSEMTEKFITALARREWMSLQIGPITLAATGLIPSDIFKDADGNYRPDKEVIAETMEEVYGRQ